MAQPDYLKDAFTYMTFTGVDGKVWQQPVINQITVNKFDTPLGTTSTPLTYDRLMQSMRKLKGVSPLSEPRPVEGISVDAAIEYLRGKGIEI